jgi:hypothetical protein
VDCRDGQVQSAVEEDAAVGGAGRRCCGAAGPSSPCTATQRTASQSNARSRSAGHLGPSTRAAGSSIAVNAPLAGNAAICCDADHRRNRFARDASADEHVRFARDAPSYERVRFARGARTGARQRACFTRSASLCRAAAEDSNRRGCAIRYRGRCGVSRRHRAVQTDDTASAASATADRFAAGAAGNFADASSGNANPRHSSDSGGPTPEPLVQGNQRGADPLAAAKSTHTSRDSAQGAGSGCWIRNP